MEFKNSGIRELTDYERQLEDTLTKRSTQIGDLKNKLIKAQQEIIELRKQLEQFTSGKVSIMTIQR